MPLLCEEFDGDCDGDDSFDLSFFDFTFLIFFNSLLEKFFLVPITDTSTGLIHGNVSSTTNKTNQKLFRSQLFLPENTYELFMIHITTSTKLIKIFSSTCYKQAQSELDQINISDINKQKQNKMLFQRLLAVILILVNNSLHIICDYNMNYILIRQTIFMYHYS